MATISLENNTITITEVNTHLDGGTQKVENLSSQLTSTNNDEFYLTATPVESTLQVFKDGMLLLRGDVGAGDYNFTPQTRLIKLHEGADYISSSDKSVIQAAYTSAT